MKISFLDRIERIWHKCLIVVPHLAALAASGTAFGLEPPECNNKICVKPHLTPWRYTLCAANGSSYMDRIKCEVSGGVYGGWLNGCPGGREPESDQQIYDWSLEIAQKYSDDPSCVVSSDSGWGTDIGSQNCGSGGPEYNHGYLVVDKRLIQSGPGTSSQCAQTFSSRKYRDLVCPPGSGYLSFSGDLICVMEVDGSCPVTNPIKPLSGIKIQQEDDFLLSGVSLSRFYNSDSSLIPHNVVQESMPFFGTHGHYWRTNFDYRLYTLETDGVTSGYALSFPSGFVQIYDGQLLPLSNLHRPGRLSAREGSFVYQDDNLELIFSNNSQLTEMIIGNASYKLKYTTTTATKPPVDPAGNPVTGNLPAGYLMEVEKQGQPLFTFDYDATGKMALAHFGNQFVHYQYSYDNLIRVLRDSGESKAYHYENAAFPAALTGITDEGGNRFATWQYDNMGRAISSEHAEGREKTLIDYSQLWSRIVEVTNPLGKKNKYHFSVIAGAKRVTQVEGQASDNCAAANKAYTYYPNGTLQSKTDWSGNSTTYVRDSFGRETARTEAAGTPQARTITTEYHATLNKPVRVIEPGLTVEMTYDTEGRLLSTQKISTP